jgi:quercetin dioxygenase-like cupin family protein
MAAPDIYLYNPSLERQMKKKKLVNKAKPRQARPKKKAVKAEVQHASWHTLELEEVNPSFHRHFLSGESVMLARILLKKGSIVPLHHHHNEQVSFVLDGKLKFTFENKEIVVNSGEVLVIPPNVPHKVEALRDSVDFDIFSPPRTDWISKKDQYLREAPKSSKARLVG